MEVLHNYMHVLFLFLLQYMKEGIELHENTVLEPDERNLLSVAYKNVVGQKRSAFRCLTGISVSFTYARMVSESSHRTY